MRSRDGLQGESVEKVFVIVIRRYQKNRERNRRVSLPVLYHVPGVLLVLLVLHFAVHQPPHHRFRLTWNKQINRQKQREGKIYIRKKPFSLLLIRKCFVAREMPRWRERERWTEYRGGGEATKATEMSFSPGTFKLADTRGGVLDAVLETKTGGLEASRFNIPPYTLSILPARSININYRTTDGKNGSKLRSKKEKEDTTILFLQ